MEEIVCSINNTDPENLSLRTAFAVVESLMSHPMSGVHSFIKAVDRFTEEDFKRLNQKIHNEQNHKIYLTEKDLIVYYSVVYFASIALKSNAESQWLAAYYSGRESTFEVLKQQVAAYAKSVFHQLRQDLKHVSDFIEVTKMIPVE